jgi:hypothetical protein
MTKTQFIHQLAKLTRAYPHNAQANEADPLLVAKLFDIA